MKPMPLRRSRVALCATVAAAAWLVAAAPARAQATVQLSGMIDIGLGRFQRPEEQIGPNTAVTGWNKIYKVDRNNEQTSYWGLSGKESLGGELSAVFRIEAFFQPDTGASGRYPTDTYFGRDAYVGLSSASLGELRLGRNGTQLFAASWMHNPFGSGFGWAPTIRHIFSGGEGKVRGDSGWSNAVAYYSPRFGGFSGGAMLAAGEGDTSAGGVGTVKAYSVGAGYAGGPFSANLVHQDVEAGNTGGRSQKTTLLGASYNLGYARLQAQFAFIDDDPTGVEDKILQVGAAIPAGPGSVLVSYGLDKTTSVASTELSTLTIGYRYEFSKRTDLTAAVMREEQDAGRTAFKTYAADITGTSYGIGVRHRF